MKQRIPALNFIRAIAAIGVIAFHYICRFDELFAKYGLFEHISWGDLLVTVFLILSGMLLYRNDRYDGKQTRAEYLSGYYLKRWTALYPAFYIAYLAAYTVVRLSNLFPDRKADPFSSIFTVLGVDGYYLEYSPNYYLVGEWFLGAIILLYLLFPLVERMMHVHLWGTIFVIAALYEVSMVYSPFHVTRFRALPSCLVSFMAGILLEHWHILERFRMVYPAAVLALPICAAISDQQDPVLLSVVAHIGGLCIFICLYGIGKYVMKLKWLALPIDRISRLSYPIFLLQHLAIRYVTTVLTPKHNGDDLPILLLCMLLTVLSARILLFMTDLLTGTIRRWGGRKSGIS